MATEHLMRCSVAKAFPGRIVDLPADGVEIAGRDLVDVGMARQEPTDAAIGVLVGSFLPRRARITVKTSQIHMLFEQGPRHKFRAAIKRDALPRMPGQG